jgi:hypothetical protein
MNIAFVGDGDVHGLADLVSLFLGCGDYATGIFEFDS